MTMRVLLPVVLLHGFAGARSAWDEVVRHLRPDLPPDALLLPLAIAGHEAPAHLASSFSGEVDRLAGQAEQGIGDGSAGGGSLFVGYSLGGRLALALALRHPRLVARAVLIGASPGLARADERRGRVADDEEWARLLEERGIGGFLDAWEAQPLFASQRELPAARREAQRRLRERLDAGELALAMRTLGLGVMPPCWDELPGIGLPVDLVVGERDGKFTALAREMARRLPSSTVHVVPGVGHNVVLEAPAAMARIVAAAAAAAVAARATAVGAARDAGAGGREGG
jgi:2-succinyl-6-hydroxy-2,4-cyclohexadiene-1-carboxylate synthase